MMKPTMVVMVAAGIAVLGTWSKDKELNPRIVVGGAVIAITFAILSDTQPKIASDFSWLILATTTGVYGDQLFKAIGDVTSGTKKVVTGNGIGGGTAMERRFQ